ncbi:MAG: hypothetical protein ACI9OJ_003333, partial [Myxococcota bacterium]
TREHDHAAQHVSAALVRERPETVAVVLLDPVVF